MAFSEIKTELPGKKAKEIISKDTRYSSSSYIKEYPLVIERGEGSVVVDVDGNRFLDFMAGIAVNVTGYSHPKVVKAIKRQSEKFFHICSTDFYYQSFADLWEPLAKIVPMSGENVIRFSPPLVISSEEVDIVVEIFREVISQYEKKREAI